MGIHYPFLSTSSLLEQSPTGDRLEFVLQTILRTPNYSGLEVCVMGIPCSFLGWVQSLPLGVGVALEHSVVPEGQAAMVCKGSLHL